MKKTIILSVLCLLFSLSYGQNKNQRDILDKFIIAHNIGSEDAIKKFIKENYEPSLYKKIDLKKHIAFYDHIVKEFGLLNYDVYKVVEVKPSKFIVQLIKKGESLLNKSIDPAEILMVEIDTSEEQPNYLSRGLGLGALVCSRRQK